MADNRKYVLLDTNVLVHYYTNRSENVTRIMNLLSTTLSKSATLFIPNFCLAEFFKVITSECFYAGNISRSKFQELKQRFIDDISRDYKFKRLQKYVHVELNRYHLFNANLVYEPAMEFMKKYHERPYFKKFPSHKKYLSTFDILVIAQGIELGRIHGYENFCILTSDELMFEIGNSLRQSGVHRRYVRLLSDTNEDFKYLKYFQYPVILKATNKYEIMKFLGVPMHIPEKPKSENIVNRFRSRMSHFRIRKPQEKQTKHI